jgi:Holliday junction resolvase RusA-like endonuclease
MQPGLRRKEYRIDIPPIAWNRPGKRGRSSFDTQAKEKLCVGISLNSQHNNEAPFERPIAVEAEFYFQRPKSHGKSHKIIYHSNVPDIDNLAKFYLDALVKCGVLQDDRIICSLTAKKMYANDELPHVLLTIIEVE